MKSAKSALHRSHVLGRAFAQPQYVLLAAGVDPDRSQHHVIGKAHPVDLELTRQ
jgi:hypothetical protein